MVNLWKSKGVKYEKQLFVLFMLMAFSGTAFAGLSASQARLLGITSRKSNLELQAQQVKQQRVLLDKQLQEAKKAYEQATSKNKTSEANGLMSEINKLNKQIPKTNSIRVKNNLIKQRNTLQQQYNNLTKNADAAAKVKYDRLQNQIQAKDKKLELELSKIKNRYS